jgi:hypothetical protein
MTHIAHPASSNRSLHPRRSSRLRLTLLLTVGISLGAQAETPAAAAGSACPASTVSADAAPSSTTRGVEYSLLWGRFQSPGYAGFCARRRPSVRVELAAEAAPDAASGERSTLWGMIRWSTRD